jgi:hypothetical protein
VWIKRNSNDNNKKLRDLVIVNALISYVGHEESVGTDPEPALPAPSPPPAPTPLNPSPLPAVLPKGFIITAEQVNELSGTRKMMRRREHQLRRRSNKEVRAALKSLSEQQHVLKTAQST